MPLSGPAASFLNSFLFGERGDIDQFGWPKDCVRYRNRTLCPAIEYCQGASRRNFQGIGDRLKQEVAVTQKRSGLDIMGKQLCNLTAAYSEHEGHGAAAFVSEQRLAGAAGKLAPSPRIALHEPPSLRILRNR